MRIAIIDDDKDFLKYLEKNIEKETDDLGLSRKIKCFSSTKNIMKEIFEYELIFLDIEMPEINGIDLLDKINDEKRGSELPLVVFITNKDNYVFTALSKYPFSFMRKSCVESELRTCLAQVDKKIKQINGNGYSIKLNTTNTILDVKDIMYVYKQRSNIIYKCVDKEYKDREIISHIADKLEPLGFIRIHEGFTVNVEYLKEMNSTKTVLKNGEELVVSRKYKDSANQNYFEWISRRSRRKSW